MVGSVATEIEPVSKDTVQMLTGHGRLKAYYHRFRLKQTDGICECGLEAETAEHVCLRCELEARSRARGQISRKAIEYGVG